MQGIKKGERRWMRYSYIAFILPTTLSGLLYPFERYSNNKTYYVPDILVRISREFYPTTVLELYYQSQAINILC